MATITAEPVKTIEIDLAEVIAEIEVSEEEILADLLYPDPPSSLR
jgi:hypothetical protein